MNTKDIITKAGGVDAVAQRFGKRRDYVQRLQYGEQLPASWHVALEQMTGEELPLDRFSFKAVEYDA